jgi:hypothetical protein
MYIGDTSAKCIYEKLENKDISNYNGKEVILFYVKDNTLSTKQKCCFKPLILNSKGKASKKLKCQCKLKENCFVQKWLPCGVNNFCKLWVDAKGVPLNEELLNE